MKKFYLKKKSIDLNKDQSVESHVKQYIQIPPDLTNPPLHLPLKSIEDRYKLIHELGNGSFGSVTLAKCEFDLNNIKGPVNTLMDQSLVPTAYHENWYTKEKGLVAIKTMIMRLPTLNDYTRVREVKFILSMPAHTHLLQIYESFIDNSVFQLHIVMEYMEQNLYQLMKHRKRRIFSLPTLKSILSQILSGISHIHNHKFFHRDIKPENILISPSSRYYHKEWLKSENFKDNYIVKIADYGLARHIMNKSDYTAYVSTRWYRSPEILLRQGNYSTPLDIWAFGCVAVEVAIFKPLFPGSDEMDQIWKILELLGTPHSCSESILSGYQPHGGIWPLAEKLAQNLNLKFPYVEGKDINWVMPNPQLKLLADVVRCCLTWNPSGRPTALEICAMPYFQNTIVDPNYTENRTNTQCVSVFSDVKEDIMVQDKLLFHDENHSSATQPIPIKRHMNPLKLHKHVDNLQGPDSDSTISGPEEIIKELSTNIELYQNHDTLPPLESGTENNSNFQILLNIQQENEVYGEYDNVNQNLDSDSLINYYDGLIDINKANQNDCYIHDIPRNNHDYVSETRNNIYSHTLDNMSIDEENLNTHRSHIPRGFLVQQPITIHNLLESDVDPNNTQSFNEGISF